MLGTEKLTFPDIRNLCRGGEGSVKGPDRVSGGSAALDAARASAMLHLSRKAGSCAPVRKGENIDGEVLTDWAVYFGRRAGREANRHRAVRAPWLAQGPTQSSAARPEAISSK